MEAIYNCSIDQDRHLHWRISFGNDTKTKLNPSELKAATLIYDELKWSSLKIEGTIVEELDKDGYGRHLQLEIECRIHGRNEYNTSALSIQGTVS